LNQKPYILAIDDNENNLTILHETLHELDATLVFSTSPQEGLKLAEKYIPDLILLDIVMPIMDGFEVCKRLKENGVTKDIPIVFLSALEGVNDKVKAFELGGVDFITKPFNPLEVAIRVKTHLKNHYMLADMNRLLKESYHEIYTPLTLIKSSLSLQELEYGENENTLHIKAATQSLHSIYEDIHYAITGEIRTYHKRWLDLKEFLDKRIKLFEAQMNMKSLQYSFDSNVESPMIYMSSIELERVYDNLLSNAIKYALKDTSIEIRISYVKDNLELKICNDAKPIENVKLLFKELYRESDKGIGIGIGLNIVKKICIKNNINISVKNENENERICFVLQYREKE